MSSKDLSIKKSYDCKKKLLFVEELTKKKFNQNMQFIAYFSEIKSEKHYEWCQIAIFFKGFLISIPSAFILIKNYFLQGPKILIIILNSLRFIIFLSFLNLVGIAVWINKKWYAFFIIYEVFKYQTIILICLTFIKYNTSFCFFLKKAFNTDRSCFVVSPR